MESPETPQKHHFKFGIFYHNKSDEKIWVPKANGLGYTLNFANKWSYVILLLFVVAIITVMILASNQKK